MAGGILLLLIAYGYLKKLSVYRVSPTVKPIPVAARSETWVCGRSFHGVVGLNPADGMGVYLLWVLCVARRG
jgi:hypothetical protein